VFGCGDGHLAHELAKRSRLRVIAVDTDAERVAAARNMLIAAGVYGSRVAVHHVDSLNELPFVGEFANLVVSASAAAEAVRVLRPGGGVLCIGTPRQAPARKLSKQEMQNLLGKTNVEPKLTDGASGRWARYVKPPLDGAGEWSHQYGLADNAAYGGETLRGARTTYEFGVQWVGRPGPRYQPDRSGRKPAPLAVNGRLFGQGRNRIVAIDAYNGTILWSLEIPLFARFNIPRDTGNWCADGEHVFAVVKNRCWQIDAATGRVVCTHDVVRGRRKEWAYE